MRKNSSSNKNNIRLFFWILGIVLICGTIGLSALSIMKNNGVTSYNAEASDDTAFILKEFKTDEKKEVSEEKIVYSGKYGELLASPDAMQQERAYALPDVKQDTVVLRFAGDILLDSEYSIMATYQKNNRDISSCISSDILSLVTDADVFMLNNEFPYTDRGEPLPNKQFTFRAKPSSVSVLNEMGVDVVSIANNHISDYGEISLIDTLETLQTAGMPYVGAGKNIEDAGAPVYFVSENIKVAVLSATQVERFPIPDTKGATENSAGTMRCMEPEAFAEQIRKAKANSDFVVAYVHWGSESTTVVDWMQRDQSKLFTEAGADLIIGDHPHVLQKISYCEDTPVFFSMGNFWFNSKEMDTGIAEVTINTNGIKTVRFIPCIQSNCTVKSADEASKMRILDTMRSLSDGVNIDSEGYVTMK